MEAAIESLIADLPDPDAARRFLVSLSENHPHEYIKLEKRPALLSDVATLAAFSPLLAATLLQNPAYLWWLDRKRTGTGVCSKDELLESLARFASTHSQLEPQVLYARFRRRELLRIYLRDIRRLATIAEITEEISNLADAILESALKLARREMDNRFGQPLEINTKGRVMAARFCIAALGKLGSRELNYSSDIDLLFLYSSDGTTSGQGSRGAVTNREYFVKLAEYLTKLVGEPTGEGAAYRVDLRLRPHGTLGPLALSASDLVRYYQTEARAWEHQVLIRSRGCAGETELFSEFFAQVEGLVFSTTETVAGALANVRRSKEQIDRTNIDRRGYNVKLGRGGIREIEFLAQALQLAYGGHDAWLRSPHTLISLARLADRHYLSETEITQLSTAYELLRRTEHVLQMENGVQTHTVPDEPARRELLGRRVTFAAGGELERDLAASTENVSRIFARVFGDNAATAPGVAPSITNAAHRTRSHVLASIAKANISFDADTQNAAVLDRVSALSPHFSAMLAANPHLVSSLPDPASGPQMIDYASTMMQAVRSQKDLGGRLSALRRTWSRHLLEIAISDIFETVTLAEAKRLQTDLCESTLAAALEVVKCELVQKYGGSTHFSLSVLALGKLGGQGLDYGSDLDLILVYDDTHEPPEGLTHVEFYGRAVELLVTTLSAMTRDGSLYRVDLRLRPYGSKGLSSMPAGAFLDYMRETAVIWEMLAFVKLRAVAGNTSLGAAVEAETRQIIHERAAAADVAELRDETRRVRLALEKQRSRTRRSHEVDIKYGAGGMLDVYFAMRYLQLRDNVPDDPADRSTPFMLDMLRTADSLEAETHAGIKCGYEFLSGLDHNLRLTVGRTTRVPLANEKVLTDVAKRMGLTSHATLLEQLTLHRLAVRAAFDEIVGPAPAVTG